MNIYEKNYEKNKLNKIFHASINYKEWGVIKLHLVPSKYSFFKTVPSTMFINGKYSLPLNLSWTILMSFFIEEIKKYNGKLLSKEQVDDVINVTVKRTKKIYHFVSKKTLEKDLLRIIQHCLNIANNNEEILDKFDDNSFVYKMRAPYKIGLILRKNETNDEKQDSKKEELNYQEQELVTEKWNQIIDICKRNCITKFVFSGNEPTEREDLISILEHSENLITVLKTNGENLTKEYCDRLYNAKVDNIQIALYSSNSEIHDSINNIEHNNESNYEKVVQGIKNAIDSKLDVTIYTPICKLNKDYLETLEFIKEMGVKSVIIEKDYKKPKINKKDFTSIIKKAQKYAEKENMEVTVIDEPKTFLDTIYINPFGDVISLEKNLGNILNTSWDKIWNNDESTLLKYSSMKGGMKDE